MWARQCGVVLSEGTVDYQEFVGRAIVAGSTDNGVFAARVMWGTLGEVINQLRTARPDGSCLRDLQVLQGTFGCLRFVYLQRHDQLAQAVSWSRAEQTGVWYETVIRPARPEAFSPIWTSKTLAVHSSKYVIDGSPTGSTPSGWIDTGPAHSCLIESGE